MKIIFAGTPAVAIPSLVRLNAEHSVVAVVTRNDAPIGRKRVLTPSPVASAATEMGIPVLKSNRLDGAVTEELAQYNAELGVVVAYGGLIKEPLLTRPALGWINLHFSELPRWRGAAPAQWSIIAGDDAAVSVFQLEESLDSGPVFATWSREIGSTETAGELLNSLAESGASVLSDVVGALEKGTAIALAQEGEITLAPKISVDDARVRWDRPAFEIDRLIRGVTPEPGAFSFLGEDRIKILSARLPEDHERCVRAASGQLEMSNKAVHVHAADGTIILQQVQPAGKKAMDAGAWFRGLGSNASTRLS